MSFKSRNTRMPTAQLATSNVKKLGFEAITCSIGSIGAIVVELVAAISGYCQTNSAQHPLRVIAELAIGLSIIPSRNTA